MISGAQAMIRCLEAEGVKLLFGYPGATIAPFYDSLVDSEVRHILVRSEQNAGHAASGYARISGKPGVCVTTSGPGATNLITAVATAYMDSIPLICITGQVPTDQLGRDVFQEADITGAVEPFTKYTYLIKKVADIPRVFKEAFYIAASGRPGPVLIDMPMDVQKEMIEFSYPDHVDIRGYKPQTTGHQFQIKKVAAAIKAAQRPLLCVGGGVLGSAGGAEAVRKFSEECKIPVICTLMGVGVMQSAHPMFYGMLGQHGRKTANRAVQESDLLILVGARVGDRAIAAPQSLESSKTIVHVDIDAAEIGKNLGPTIPLVGDAAFVVNELCSQSPVGDWADWLKILDERRAAEPPACFQDKSDGTIDPHVFIRELSNALDDDAIYVADVGQNQLYSAKNYIVRGGRFLTTGGMGTMGYSIPAAIGAKAAAPERQVIAVCGDGSFQMSLMEFATSNQHQIPIKLIVFRNGYLGLVREIQNNAYNRRESGVCLDGSPEIGGIAAAYGIPFMQLTNDCNMEKTIQAFVKAEGSFILECVVDPNAPTN